MNYKQVLILLGGIALAVILTIKNIFITEYNPGVFYMTTMDYLLWGFIFVCIVAFTLMGIKYFRK